MHDFYRVSTAVPDVSVGDVNYNYDRIIEKIEKAERYESQIIAFPEMAITGYSCQDLFFQNSLLKKSNEAIKNLVAYSERVRQVIIVGAPFKYDNRLYNAAYVIFGGCLCGITLKTYLPNYAEFYEKRWFDSATDLPDKYSVVDFNGESVQVGNNIIYDLNGLKFAVEICEDLWAPVSPGTLYSLAGAELIINISASNELISKRDHRKNLIIETSA
ncbi:MAG TPA: NAD(+) synthase, partial [Lachnospiraceae bacterium]|nr:NAD(+) synthase [Lachnospiraceae bacterium]